MVSKSIVFITNHCVNFSLLKIKLSVNVRRKHKNMLICFVDLVLFVFDFVKSQFSFKPIFTVSFQPATEAPHCQHSRAEDSRPQHHAGELNAKASAARWRKKIHATGERTPSYQPTVQQQQQL